MPYRILSVGLSDVGLLRENNEDVWAQLPELKFYVLADGMGGHQAGEVAAKETVDALCRIVKKKLARKRTTFLEAHALIQQAIEDVNQLIYEMGVTHKDLRGMGTTLCCLHIHDHGLIYGHVGDSRIYRFRQEKLEQLTKDHSLLSDLLDLGQLSQEEAREFLYKNVITKAIGTEGIVEPSVHLTDIQSQDIYLLCSDGLTDLATRKEIETVLRSTKTIQEAAAALIQLARMRGAPDNITVLLTKIENGDTENLPR